MNEKQTSATQSQVKPTSVNEPSQVKQLRPTKKQRELLVYIEQFIAEHGYSPSYREIMSGLHYNSVATVALHVGNLIKRGHLLKRDNSARSLEVVRPSGDETPARLLTNQISESEEKWLVEKVEKLCADAEAGAIAEPRQLDDIATVLEAMRVLGLAGASHSFHDRLKALRGQAANDIVGT